jgi:RNA polymerase sigma factor (TIGR02999 family)
MASTVSSQAPEPTAPPGMGAVPPRLVEELVPLVYDQLRRIARRRLRAERADHTLTTTALVHEAWLRLSVQERAEWQNPAHLVAVAAQVIRRILVDHARRHNAARRGGGRTRVSFERMALSIDDESDAVLALDDALLELDALDHRQAQVVECRFFGGLTEEETAQALGITARTVRRDWVKARAFLHGRLVDGDDSGCPAGSATE